MDFQRQNDIISQDELRRYPVTIVGVGGIGSPLAVLLAKMGVTDLTVYDPDVVEEHNLASQFYRLQDVDALKVEALAAICRDFTGVELTTHAEEFPLDTPLRGILVAAVDSMAVRKQIWERAVKFQPAVDCYLEARMGGQEGRVYTVAKPGNPEGTVYTVRSCDPDDVERYEATLYSDEEAEELPCTARAIGYNTWYLASLIASQIQKFVMQKEICLEVMFDLATLLELTPS